MNLRSVFDVTVMFVLNVGGLLNLEINVLIWGQFPLILSLHT